MKTTTLTTASHEFTGCKKLHLENHSGEIHVTTHDAEDEDIRIHLTAHGDVDLGVVETSQEGGLVRVEIPQLVDPERANQGFSFKLGPINIGSGGVEVDVEVDLPSNLGVNLTTKHGDIAATGSLGDTRARTGAGDIVLDRCLELKCATGAGEINVLGSCTGGTATTGTGDVTIESVEGGMQLRSGAGDVTVRQSSGGEITAGAGAGDIRIDLLSGSATCKTGAGSITVTVPGREPVWLDLSSGVGQVRKEIDKVGEPEPDQPYLSVKARSGMGDVTVRSRPNN